MLVFTRRKSICTHCLEWPESKTFAVCSRVSGWPGHRAGFRSALRRRKLIDKMREYGVGRIATIVGRYYAMDRDKRWERTEKAYRLLRYGEGTPGRDPVAAIRESYGYGVTDEFVKPIVIVDNSDTPIAAINDADEHVLADRIGQDRSLEGGFPLIKNRTSVLPTTDIYDRRFPLPVAFRRNPSIR